MENLVDIIRNNKARIIVVMVLLTLVIIVAYLFVNHSKKQYSLTEVLQYNYYILNKEGKYGVIDNNGNIIIETKYDNVKIPNPEKPVFICEDNNTIIALNEKSDKIFDKYEEVNVIPINGLVSNLPYEKSVLMYKLNGKYGLINYEGKVITKPIYDEIKGLENKESELIVKTNEKYGVINAKGAKLIKEEYDQISADGFYTEQDKYGLSGYIVGNKTTDGYRYGYITHNLKKILDVEYNDISRILEITDRKDIYLITCKNGRYGVIKNNDTMINYTYQEIEYDNKNKIFQVQRNLKYGVCNIEGKEIIPTIYSEIEFKGIYLKALKNSQDKGIYYDMQGNQIQNLKYTSVQKTDNDNYYITITEDKLYGIEDKDKYEIIQNKYSYLEYLFGEYFIAANEEGKLGIINIKDEVLIDFKYEVLQKIDDTEVVQAKILKENKSEIYSRNLEMICSVIDASVQKEQNYIKVLSDKNMEYFDFEGKKLNSKQIYINNKLFASKQNDKWGFVDQNGNVVVEYKYDKVTEFNEYGYAGIKKDGKWGSIKEDGTVVLEPIYVIDDKNIEPEFLNKYYKNYYGYGESYYIEKIDNNQ